MVDQTRLTIPPAKCTPCFRTKNLPFSHITAGWLLHHTCHMPSVMDGSKGEGDTVAAWATARKWQWPLVTTSFCVFMKDFGLRVRLTRLTAVVKNSDTSTSSTYPLTGTFLRAPRILHKGYCCVTHVSFFTQRKFNKQHAKWHGTPVGCLQSAMKGIKNI